MSAVPLRVSASNGDPLAEAVALTKRLKLPYLRRALTDLVPTAKAQRWDPAEVVRVEQPKNETETLWENFACVSHPHTCCLPVSSACA